MSSLIIATDLEVHHNDYVVLDKATAVVSFAGHFVFDLALGIAVIFRSLASQFVFGSSVGTGVFILVFGFAFAAFSRLLNRDSRA